MGVNYTQFSGVPVPDEDAVDDVPYWLTQIFGTSLDSALVLKASSNADRDSRLYLAPMGAICVVVDATPTVQAVYVKTSAPGTSVWGTVWKAPVAPVWTPLSLATDMTYLTSVPSITVDNNNVWATLKGDIQTISTATLANGTTVATIPSQFVLAETVKIPVAMNQIPTNWGTGYIVIDSTTNNINTWGITGASGGALQPQWAALWGVRFQCHQ